MCRIPTLLIALILILSLPMAVRADHLDVTLAADPVLVDAGLMKHLLPRFSLKTGIKLHLSSETPDVTLTRAKSADARPAIKGPDHIYFIALGSDASDKAIRFADWLLGDIGQRAIDQFRQNDVQVFSAAADTVVETPKAPPDGNIQNGERLAYSQCGRCHVVGEKNRMKGIGSTPSFPLLRGFSDWQDRVLGFYALNPHPSFSQIKDVTEPFDIALPPAIIPIDLTLDELDDIVAYIASITPADLGAPLQTQ